MMMEIDLGLEMLAILNHLTRLLIRKHLIVFCRRENIQEIVPNPSRVKKTQLLPTAKNFFCRILRSS
jgi:hypothetical protein